MISNGLENPGVNAELTAWVQQDGEAGGGCIRCNLMTLCTLHIGWE
jgi:hypothetical protein